MLFKVHHIIHGITCIKLYDHVCNKVSNSQAILALILKITLLVLLVLLKEVFLITDETLTVYTRSPHINIQSSEQTYTKQTTRYNQNSTPPARKQVENVIKYIYASLRSHRREDHENQSYNGEDMNFIIFTRFSIEE